MKQYCKIAFLYQTKYLYTLWYTNDISGVLSINGRIQYFDNESKLMNYCKEEGISIEDNIVIYNIDKIKEIILNNSINIDCKYILNLWNIIDDIAKTINIPFYGNNEEVTDIYNKIFSGNNLPVIRGNDVIYVPKWDNEEIKTIIKIIKECYKIFGLSIAKKLRRIQPKREGKGSFFTPKIWADKSKEYLSDVFGKNWQDEYYIWDCAAGTGNLLAGLTNKYNIWASDIEQGNIETIQSLIDIDENLNLLPGHVFQFDFLNDDFKDLPEELKKIIDDPEKRKKLIIYINPPYAEVSSQGATETKGRKAGVNQSKTHDTYAGTLGTAGREIFALFLARIYHEISGCKIGEFSTLKLLNGSALDKFRDFFKAKLERCFIVPANTFDNVGGQFPIGFKIWDTDKKEKFKSINADIFDVDNKAIGKKTFFAFSKNQFINKWIGEYKTENTQNIGYMDGINGNDFQHNNIVYIINSKELLPNPRGIWMHEHNLLPCSVYFFARHCFEHTWINHNDQFLYPNGNIGTDIEFCLDTLMYTLFHGKNNIQSQYGVNHWIPFTENEVNAKEKFESNFMSSFIKDKIFSGEAKVVLKSGKALWQYYHSKIVNNKTVSVNSSFYDIREYFQGRNEKGTMKTKSDDEQYNILIKELRNNLSLLAEKIKPKVYEYGFLKE